VALGLRATLTYSDDRLVVWQEPEGALVEALSVEDTTIKTKDPAEEALELVHAAVLVEHYLVIHLSFSKSEGGDQVSPIGKPQFIPQTQAGGELLRKNVCSRPVLMH
jgi:hypothetical protein